jgi:hypothetical protein
MSQTKTKRYDTAANVKQRYYSKKQLCVYLGCKLTWLNENYPTWDPHVRPIIVNGRIFFDIEQINKYFAMCA